MGTWDKISYKIVFFVKMLKYRVAYGDSLQVGTAFSFRKRFNININDNGKVKIGSHVFFNSDCVINCKSEVTIGDDCIFGENVKIYDHNHIFSNYSQLIRKQGYKAKPVIIGNNCWIGSSVVILPGAIIKPNSIIGAGCVISGEVPEGMIVTSNRELQFKRRNRNDR